MQKYYKRSDISETIKFISYILVLTYTSKSSIIQTLFTQLIKLLIAGILKR